MAQGLARPRAVQRWIRKVPDATVIDEVEAFAKDWGWQIDERADADASQWAV